MISDYSYKTGNYSSQSGLEINLSSSYEKIINTMSFRAGEAGEEPFDKLRAGPAFR
jgi:hypothetical protein